MNITNYILQKSNLKTDQEPTDFRYKMFNTGGVECEVGEFLYSLVRMIKPVSILETGTHFGISSTYMALGMKHNETENGVVVTIDPIYWSEAKTLHEKMEVLMYIKQVEMHAENYNTSDEYDLIFLDSEPILRFNEFDKFFKNLKPGGIIIIHDLHPHFCYNNVNTDHPEFKHWPYGDFTQKLGPYIKNLDVQVISFNTPRGMTMFQKKSLNMSYVSYLNNTLL